MVAIRTSRQVVVVVVPVWVLQHPTGAHIMCPTRLEMQLVNVYLSIKPLYSEILSLKQSISFEPKAKRRVALIEISDTLIYAR